MKVKELVKLLTTMPQDALVVTEVYTDGFDTVNKASIFSVKENPQKKHYNGQYIDAALSEIMYEGCTGEAIDVVLLSSEIKSEN